MRRWARILAAAVAVAAVTAGCSMEGPGGGAMMGDRGGDPGMGSGSSSSGSMSSGATSSGSGGTMQKKDGTMMEKK